MPTEALQEPEQEQVSARPSPTMKELFNPLSTTNLGMQAASVGALGFNLAYAHGPKLVGHNLLHNPAHEATHQEYLQALSKRMGINPANVERFSEGMPGHVSIPQPGQGIQHFLFGRNDMRHSILGHELGHGQLEEKLYKAHPGLLRTAQLGYQLSPFATSAATLAAASGNAPARFAGLLTAAPRLIQELAASHYGGAALAGHEGGSFARRAGNYLSAYKGVPTYMTEAATPFMAYHAGQWLHKRRNPMKLKKKEETEKSSSLITKLALASVTHTWRKTAGLPNAGPATNSYQAAPTEPQIYFKGRRRLEPNPTPIVK